MKVGSINYHLKRLSQVPGKGLTERARCLFSFCWCKVTKNYCVRTHKTAKKLHFCTCNRLQQQVIFRGERKLFGKKFVFLGLLL